LIATRVAEGIKRDFTVPVWNGEERHAKIRQQMMETTLKKFPPSAERSKELDGLTYEKFSRVNKHLMDFNGSSYPAKTARIQSSTSERHRLLLRSRALIHSFIGRCWEEDFFPFCKFSGGVSQGCRFDDTSPEAKLTFPITITARCIPLFEEYLKFDSLLNLEVQKWNLRNPTRDKYRVVSGSRATTVLKDNLINRFIAVEPTGNSYLQQGLMGLLYKLLGESGLDVRTLPDRHQMLALISSITGKDATVDWFSASDLSLRALVEFLFPPSWFGYMNKCSSRYILQEGELVKLNMFSTMGNAVTFPLETLVFYALGVATVMAEKHDNRLHSSPEERAKVSVFGDDCIVPTQTAVRFIENCESVGFIANEEKSFYSDGSGFRESCGGDYLRGYNVRPFYLKGPTSERPSALEPWLYTILNALIPHYTRYWGCTRYVYDKEVFALICSLFWQNDLKLKLVPSDYPEDSGLVHTQDVARFLKCYNFPIDHIWVGESGSVSFRYLRFQYRSRRETNDGFHYATWLKAHANELDNHARREAYDPSHVDRILPKITRKPIEFTNTKRVGGYVVARGLTAHWTVPGV